MADQTDTPQDPGKAFLDAVTKWERDYDANANKMMGTELFSQWMNQMQTGQLTMQKAYVDFVTGNLQNMNIPTRDDVIRLAESVRAVDARLERLETMIEKLVGEPERTPRTRPARTRKPTASSGDES